MNEDDLKTNEEDLKKTSSQFTQTSLDDLTLKIITKKEKNIT